MSAADTGLLVIDVQEKLMAKIPAGDRLIRNIAFLIDGAGLLGLPVQATEQYPKGLGPTVPELVPRLPPRPDKVSFSCCAVPSVVEGFRRAARPKIVLAGIETHVCVQQTALEVPKVLVREKRPGPVAVGFPHSVGEPGNDDGEKKRAAGRGTERQKLFPECPSTL